MYKYYAKNDYNVMEYDFDSITEFIDYIDKTPVQINKFGNNPSSEDDDYDFCKTHTLEEAKQLCKFGYHENFDKLIELKIQLERYIKMSSARNRQYNYYVGYAPDVKAYLEGSPLSMLNKQNPRQKHIDIYYNSAISSIVSANQIFNRGAITLMLVEILESMGFTVGLNIFAMAQTHDQIHYAKFNLKRPGERLNVLKLYFPLCHPSFIRRLVLRLMEATPDINSIWHDGYGTPCNDYTIRTIIDLKPNDIVICRPDEMNIRGYDIVDDANNMFDYINNFDGKDFELEKIKKSKRMRN